MLFIEHCADSVTLHLYNVCSVLLKQRTTNVGRTLGDIFWFALAIFFSHTVTNHAQSFWPMFLLEFRSAKCILFSPDWPDVVRSVLVTYMYGRWQVAYAYIRHCLWLYIVHNVSYCHSLPRSSPWGRGKWIGSEKARREWLEEDKGGSPASLLSFPCRRSLSPASKLPAYTVKAAWKGASAEERVLYWFLFQFGFCFRLWKLQQAGLY